MAIQLRIFPETVRTLAFGSIGVAYAGIGTSITNPARILLIQNLTDAAVMFSFDGVNDHFPLATYSFILLDITANKTINDGFFLAEGERLYVKRIGVPTVGSVYFTVFFGEG